MIPHPFQEAYLSLIFVAFADYETDDILLAYSLSRDSDFGGG